MLPGTTIIKQCSECSGYITQETIVSGNTIGAVIWTDGKMEDAYAATGRLLTSN